MLHALARRLRLLWVLLLVTGLTACGGAPEVMVHDAAAHPERLSEWGLLRRDGDRLVLGRGVVPYEVNTPLFSDYALKFRTWYLPTGSSMRYRDPDSFAFPPGSIITKTFFYPEQNGIMDAQPGWDGDIRALDLSEHRLVETRLLIRREDGWEALPYVWDGDDAYLRITGDLVPLQLTLADEVVDLAYVVPARSECAGCHATDHTAGTLELIGLKARHLNRPYPGRGANQLAEWAEAGHLQGLPEASAVPAGTVWDDPEQSLAHRARAYLDSNCGHCHSATGAADTSGLLLDAGVHSYRQLGVCKPPIAAGRGTGGRRFSIVPGDPDASILVFRMETSDPATRMPEVGRAVAHREGVALVRDWISRLPGECLQR